MEVQSNDDGSGSFRPSGLWKCSEFRRRHPRWGVGLAAVVAFTSCAVPERPEVDAEQDLASLIGSADAIEFRTLEPNGEEVVAETFDEASLALPTAIERALRADPGIQSALARVRFAAAQADQQRSLRNPILSLTFRAGGPVPVTEASLGQEIVAVLTRPSRMAAADDRLRAAAADAMKRALDLVSEVEVSYSEAQSSLALLALLDERVALLERLIDAASTRLEGGEGTRSDVVTLTAQRVELEVLADRTRADLEAAKLELVHLIGAPRAATTFALDPWIVPAEESVAESQWIDRALRGRPEIQAAAWRLAALGEEAKWVERALFDSATIGIDAERSDALEAGPALSVPLPFFDRGQAAREAHRALVIEARHELLASKRDVIHEVRSAYRSARASERSLRRIREEWMPRLAERWRLAEDDYRAGQTDVTPLFLAEHDLRVTQMHAIEVETAAALARTRLRRAAGGASTESSSPGTNSATPESPAR